MLPHPKHFLALLLLLSPQEGLAQESSIRLGPLWDEFPLTLESGHRKEGGPLFYDEKAGSRRTWAITPLLSYTRDPDLDMVEFDIAYPVLTYDRYGKQYRFQIGQLFSFAGGDTQTENERHRFTLYPIYFQQRSSDPAENYTAYGPFYGHLKHRLMRDEIDYVMFPLYSKTRRADVITRNYLYPIVHVREGNGLQGWQVWPFVGHEHKDVTSRTNGFDEVELLPGHDKRFVLWPLYFNQISDSGTANEGQERGIFPAYSTLRSPVRDSTTVLWPFFSHIDDREKGYKEWDLPWPLIEFSAGSKTTTRVFPFYSHAFNTNLQSDFVLWPVYKYNRVHAEGMDRRRTRIAFFLYSDTHEQNLETQRSRRRTDFLPFFTRRREWNGDTRLQVLAPLEPFLPGSHKIERDYSHVWSLWRDERNAATQARSQSLLWNLYRRDVTPESKSISFFFGCYQSRTNKEQSKQKLFFIPIRKTSLKQP